MKVVLEAELLHYDKILWENLVVSAEVSVLLHHFHLSASSHQDGSHPEAGQMSV